MSLTLAKILFNFTPLRVCSTKYQRNEVTTLYKHLLKQCQKLPKGPKEHYQFMIKQSFKQHINESDPERVRQIVKRSYEDCEWILKKYLTK
ncbi:unnamed protein product [Ceutorhynchus assimilis]|uniref:LYR motif-containing protein 9 n=1 Tax=Ceutorhynchus assimilis TaxID=467358 RepID=A0A9N9QJW4_9CUCU|nr:unnamed protein product [Ceutorhynchus assimilis]